MIARVRELRAGTDNVRAIKAGIDALARVTDTFAARRMDNSIRSALAGHKVDELPSEIPPMTQIIVLPTSNSARTARPRGRPGTTLCDALLEHGIDIEHACEKSCACTTCHVIVREASPR